MSDVQQICDLIRLAHRRRQFAMKVRKSNDNAIGAFMRVALGWSKELPEAERKPIERAAAHAIEVGEKKAAYQRKMVNVVDQDKLNAMADEIDALIVADKPYCDFFQVIDSAIAAREPFDIVEKEATKEMERLAVLLPVWSEWAKDIHGFGAKSLAVIIGEAGNLSLYATHSKLWKRLGLAVMDGVRQGGLPSSAKAQTWVDHGYSRKRRSLIWTIGDVLVKQIAGPYRKVYDDRKAKEQELAALRGQVVEPASKNTKNDPDHFMSAMHVHRRAQRYMEKRLLRDLWRAWNAVEGQQYVAEKAHERVPDAAADEGTATAMVPETAIQNVPSPHRTHSREVEMT